MAVAVLVRLEKIDYERMLALIYGYYIIHCD